MSTMSMLRRAALVSTVVVAAAASPSGASTMRTTGHDVGSMKPFGKPPSARIAPRHERLSHLSHAVTGIPFHQLGAQFCDGGQIRITVPQAVYPWYAGTREYIYYRADVYRWTTSGWSFYKGTQWARAIAGPQGLENVSSAFPGQFWSWYDGSRYTDYLNPVKRISVGPGTYEVLQQIVWGTHQSSPHAEIPRFVNRTSQYCAQ